MRYSRWRWNRRKSRWLLEFIPLLAEERWRDSLIEAGAPGWAVRRNVPAELTTPSAPSLRSAHPPLLSEEGNTFYSTFATFTTPVLRRRSRLWQFVPCLASSKAFPRWKELGFLFTGHFLRIPYLISIHSSCSTKWVQWRSGRERRRALRIIHIEALKQ